MDSYEEIEEQKTGISFSPTIVHALKTQAYWARFIGMVGMIFYSLALMFVILSGDLFRNIILKSLSTMGAEAVATVVMIIYGLIFIGGLFFSYLMFDHGRKVLIGLQYEDQDSVDEGFYKLSLLFKIAGIITAIFLGFYGILFVASIISGGLAALMG